MESNVTTLDETTRQVAVTVPAEEVSKALDSAYRRLGKQAKLPGFRKGRVPRNVLEARYRHEVEQEVVEELISTSLQEAVASHRIEAVGRPQVEGASLQPGEPLAYTAVVQVIPQFELRSLEGERFVKKVVRVTEEDLKEQLANLAEHHASYEASENETLAEGDYAVIDFVRLEDGQEAPGGAVQAHPIILGDGALHPSFEEQIIGAGRGDVVEVTLPTDGEVAGERLFRVTVQEVKKRRVPTLDEDFPRTVGEESMETLRATLLREMERFEQKRATERLRADVSRRLVELHDVPVPEALIEMEVQRLLGDVQRSMAAQGKQLDASQIRAEQLSERLREPARDRAHSDLVLERMAEQKEIEPTEGDIQTEVARLAHRLNKEPAEIREEMEREGTLEVLRLELKRSLALDALVEEATVTEELVDRKEVEEADEQ